MSVFASLGWYAEASQTIESIYQQELHRPADFGGWANWLYHAREGRRDADWIRARIQESDEWHMLHDHPEPSVVTLPRLVPTGHVFRLETGERFTAIECSDFNLLGRYILEGEQAVRTVLADRASVGFNMLRVWTRYSGDTTFAALIGRLLPSEHPEVYTKLPAFLSLCASYGFYVELTAFAGGPRADHWERLTGAVQGISNVIVELVNENNAYPDNLKDIDTFRKVPGLICSHGSNGSQAVPPRPPWDYEVFHTNDAFEWWRKAGHNGMELSEGDAEHTIIPSRVPVIANENTRPDRDSIINHHEDAAAAAALLIAGYCFHSRSGRNSVPFDAFDFPYAAAVVRGMRSVDLEFQAGRYSHASELEGPGDLRVYQRILTDGRRATVRVRK